MKSVAILLFLILIISPQIFAQNYIAKQIGHYIGITTVGDFDNDGDIDIIAVVRDGFANNQILFRNENGKYSEYYKFPALLGRVEFTVSGTNNVLSLTSSNSSIYSFTENNWIKTTVLPFEISKFCLTDINNDNIVDYVIENSNNIFVYNVSSDKTENLSNIFNIGKIQFESADLNNDGKLDIVIAAKPFVCQNSECPDDSTQLFIGYATKNGFNFKKILNTYNVNHFQIRDYNNDFYKDLLFCNASGIGFFSGNGNDFSLEYFKSIENVVGTYWLPCGDDNQLKILYTTNSNQTYLIDNQATKVFPQISSTQYCFADFDNDGDMDLLTNSSRLIAGRLYGFFFNSQGTNSYSVNTPPNRPTHLQTKINESDVQFSWFAATDNTTPQAELTYNIYIGSKPLQTDIMSPLADLNTGFRKIVGIGNVDANLGWKIVDLPCGTYYWSVQAIDNSFVGGQFAAEQCFTISCGILANNFCYGETTSFSSSLQNIQTTLWHFGDGHTSSELTPSHTYEVVGKYTVKLEATFTDNTTQTLTKDIEIFAKPKTLKIMFEK